MFAALTVLMLLANLLSRSNVADLDRTLTSLRNDRLLPAAFAHQIHNLLYENKLMMAENNHPAKIKANLAAIGKLEKQYEATDLTADEAAQWSIFKLQLDGFLKSDTGPGQIALRDVYFNQMQHTLDKLITIQITESTRLMESSKRVVSSNVLLSNLVTGLCLIFGLITLVLLNLNYHEYHKPEPRHMLN